MPEYDAGTVKATMVADSKGLHGGVEAAKKDMQSLQDEAKRVKEAWRDMGLGAGVSFAAITAGILKATQANNQLKASMMGMDSIAKGTVGTYSKIEAELKKIKDDGMIPLTNAIAAYKNLLMRYEDEEIAIKMFHRLADAAAFGRQGQLSLGEAIQSASEGLKNENSVLVDNAGVTKNVSVMWKEYAAQIGKTVGELTNAEKHQAEINGIMKETRHQVGDLAKLQSSLSGELARANAETTQATAAFGDALEPALSKAVGGYSALMRNIREFIQATPGLVAGITAGAAAMTGLVAVSSAWIALDMGAKIAAGFSALTGPIGLTMIALSSLAAVIIGVKTEMAKLDEERVKLADSYGKQAAEVEELITEYESLKSKTKLTTEEKKRLLEVSNRISEILPQAAKGYDAEGNAIIDVNRALKEMIILKGQEFKLREEAIRKEVAQSEKQLRAAEREIERLNKTWDLMKARWGVSDVNQIEDPLLRERAKELEAEYNSELRKTNAEITNISDTIQAKKDQITYINDLLDGKITRQMIKGGNKKSGATEPPPPLTDEEEKRLEKQAELKLKLEAESLEAIGAMREAALKEEELRYEKEKQIAKGNKALLAEVEQNHQLRIYAINREYDQKDQEISDERLKRYQQAINDKYQLERNLTDWQKQELLKRMQAELDTLLEINGASIEEIQALQMAIEKLSQETMPDMEQKTAEWGQELIDSMSAAIARGESLNDVFKNLLTSIAEFVIKTKILQPLLGGVFSGLGGGGAALASAGAAISKMHTGGMITASLWEPVRAHTGILVGDLKRDEVPIIAQTGERVLSRDQNRAYEKGMTGNNVSINIVNQSSQPVDANQNSYFDGERYIVDVVLKDLERNGPIRKRLKDRL